MYDRALQFKDKLLTYTTDRN